MRKSTIFLLVAALLLSLAGCAKDPVKPTEPAPTVQESQDAPTQAPTAVPTAEPTEIPTEPPTEAPTEPPFKTVYYWTTKKIGNAIYTRSYDSGGNMLTDTYSSGDGYAGYASTYTYDENGNCLSEKIEDVNADTVLYTYTYDQNGKKLTESVKSPSADNITRFYYDEMGYLEKTILTEPDGAQFITYYTNDQYGQVIEKLEQSLVNGTAYDLYLTLYEYDSMGNMISWAHYSRGSLNMKKVWTYDESGHLTGEYIHHNGSSSYRGTVYEYDEQGRLIKEFEATFVDGVAQYVPSAQRYIYNDAGQCIERYTEYNAEKGHRTIYVYDEYGNLSKELHYERGSDTVSYQFEYTYIAIEVPNN